jgi:hypothetical protein
VKVLLDECIPRKLRYSLPEHECQTVPEAGLAGKKNGSLLDFAESAGFGIIRGWNTSRIWRAGASRLLMLRAKSNRLADLIPASENRETGVQRRAGVVSLRARADAARVRGPRAELPSASELGERAGRPGGRPRTRASAPLTKRHCARVRAFPGCVDRKQRAPIGLAVRWSMWRGLGLGAFLS